MGKKKKHKNNNHTSAMKQNENVNTENAVSAAEAATAAQNDSGFSVALEENSDSTPPAIPPKGQEDLNSMCIEPPRKSASLKLSLFLQRVINLAAIAVFIGSIIYLGQIGFAYIQSYNEYHSLQNEYISTQSSPTPVPTVAPSGSDKQESSGEPSTDSTEQPSMSVAEAYGYTPFSVDFDGLKKANEDVVAWIDFPGLDISYPVVLGDDNEYYLRHTYKGTYNLSGAIFFDSNMKADPEAQPNTLIYGHNQNNGKMFSNLHMLEDEATAREHSLVVLYTPDGPRYYTLFSVRIRPSTDGAYIMNYSSDQQFQDYIDTAISHSLFDFGQTVTSDDHIITLVTCCDDSNYRLVVHAVEIY